MVSHAAYRESIPLNEYARRVFDVRGMMTATVQGTLTFGTWGTAVLTLKRSNDRITFVALSSPTTMTAAGMTAAIDVSGFAWLAVEATTLEGSAAYAELNVSAKSDNALG